MYQTDRQAGRQAGKQADGLMHMTDFIGHLLQNGGFQKSDDKILNYLASLWAIWKELIQKKEIQST